MSSKTASLDFKGLYICLALVMVVCGSSAVICYWGADVTSASAGALGRGDGSAAIRAIEAGKISQEVTAGYVKALAQDRSHAVWVVDKSAGHLRMLGSVFVCLFIGMLAVIFFAVRIQKNAKPDDGSAGPE